MKNLYLALLALVFFLLSGFVPQHIFIYEHGASIQGRWRLLSQIIIDSNAVNRDSTLYPMDSTSYFSFQDNGRVTAKIQSVFDTAGVFITAKYAYNKRELVIMDGSTNDTFSVQTLMKNKMALFNRKKVSSQGVTTIVRQWIYLSR